jgi:hypothetical protein
VLRSCPRPSIGLYTCDRRVGSEVVNAVRMTYVIQRKSRFYVVDYDGLDPRTGRERRR